MTNLENIKIHLKELFPSVILFYYFNNNSLANTKKGKPIVAINKYYFFKENSLYEESLDKSIEGKNVVIINNLAINLFLLLFHEIMGHNKFSYNNNGCISPKKIINENNELIELKRYCDYNFKEKDKEYILGINCNNKGDSGSYLELAFGKFGRNLITNLLLKITDKSKLMNRVDLFTDKTCETLRKYAILKTLVNEKKIELNENIEKSTIEEEIAILEKYIDYEKIIKEKLEEKDKIDNKDKGKDENNDEEDNKDKMKLIGKKKKRAKKEFNDDNDEESEIESYKKKKDDTINIENEIENSNDNESIIEENSEDNDSKNSNISDDDELFQKLYKKILRKYNFKDDEFVFKKILDKLKDETISSKDKEDLFYVSNYLDNVD